MKRFARSALPPVIAALLAATTAGCHLEPTTPVQPVSYEPVYSQPVRVEDYPGDPADPTCLMPMKPEDRQLAAVVSPADPATSSGTEVCVFEPQPDGSYVQHYYSQDESSQFADYWLYVTLWGARSQGLLAAATINGDLKPEEALLLSLLASVDQHGGLYYPYTRNARGGGWTRHKTPTEGVVSRVITKGGAVDHRSARINPPVASPKPLPSPNQTAYTGSEAQRAERRSSTGNRIQSPAAPRGRGR